MQDQSTLGNFKSFNYVLYMENNEKLFTQYKKMYAVLNRSGFIVSADWALTGGILLEDTNDVIAGIFFNTAKFDDQLLVQLAYVDPAYRKNGIYTMLHSHVTEFCKQHNREYVYSYIHVNNKLMIEHIANKIGYTPVMQLVRRRII